MKMKDTAWLTRTTGVDSEHRRRTTNEAIQNKSTHISTSTSVSGLDAKQLASVHAELVPCTGCMCAAASLASFSRVAMGGTSQCARWVIHIHHRVKLNLDLDLVVLLVAGGRGREQVGRGRRGRRRAGEAKKVFWAWLSPSIPCRNWNRTPSGGWASDALPDGRAEPGGFGGRRGRVQGHGGGQSWQSLSKGDDVMLIPGQRRVGGDRGSCLRSKRREKLRLVKRFSVGRMTQIWTSAELNSICGRPPPL
ncbi:hypothetical protein C8J57DRAFT_1253521 [Mycena rebaudengoi]|nr:hypothetical protein C8J57DRAFT_1253521 [Mycena rebaudengoi]